MSKDLDKNKIGNILKSTGFNRNSNNRQKAKPKRDDSDSVLAQHDSGAKKDSSKLSTLNFDNAMMSEIVAQLIDVKSAKEVSYVRMTPEEKKFIYDFIMVDLYRKGLDFKSISESKIMRFCVAYILLNHREEFTDVLIKQFTDDKKSTLFDK